MRLLVIHGPNLQLLGSRQPSMYGKTDLTTINQELKRLAATRGVILTIVQSNHEGEIVELIGKAKGRHDALLINPAAYTHTSLAIRDAIEAAGLLTVEVHLSNIYAREPFRQHSLVAPVCQGQISGFGPQSYRWGFEALVALWTARSSAIAITPRPTASPARRRASSSRRRTR